MHALHPPLNLLMNRPSRATVPRAPITEAKAVQPQAPILRVFNAMQWKSNLVEIKWLFTELKNTCRMRGHATLKRTRG
eukprot:1160766-Pelagomonas_calceolata.AAC.2